MIKNNYKTVLCRNFQETGDCQFGENWKFAHGDTDLRPSQASYPMAGYNSYAQPNPYGTYSSEPQATPEGYYGYGVGYLNYQDQSTIPGAYGGSITSTELSDSNQVYNYSYESYPGYYQGYNYDAASVEGQAAASTPGMQTYYGSQSTMPEKYKNSGSG